MKTKALLSRTGKSLVSGDRSSQNGVKHAQKSIKSRVYSLTVLFGRDREVLSVESMAQPCTR